MCSACLGDRQLSPVRPRPQQQGQCVDDRLREDDSCAWHDRAPTQRTMGRGKQGGRLPHRPELPHHLSERGHQHGLLPAGEQLRGEASHDAQWGLLLTSWPRVLVDKRTAVTHLNAASFHSHRNVASQPWRQCSFYRLNIKGLFSFFKSFIKHKKF